MNYDNACKRYFSRNPKANRILHRLMRWKENEIISSSKKCCGFSTSGNAHQFARNYGLQFLILPSPCSKRTPLLTKQYREEAIKVLSRKNWSLRQIGIVIGVSHERIAQIIRESKGKT